MAAVWKEKFSFNTGAVRKRDILYFVLTNDKLAAEQKPHAEFAIWHAGKWLDAGMKKWASPGLTVLRQPKEQLLGVGEMGEAFVQGSGDVHEETVQAGADQPSKRGTLRTARWIGTHAYAAGMDRQVYRRDGVNVWTAVDQSMRPPKGDPSQVVGFESIDGFSEQDIYAVGWQGAIWHYDGKTWTQEDSPTNVILGGVCCAGDGMVYACGRLGTLLRGKAGRWEVLKHESTEADLYGLAWYEGALYVASMKGIFRLTPALTLDLVVMGEDPPATTAYHLSAADGILMSVGAKDVMVFDGKTWTRIE